MKLQQLLQLKSIKLKFAIWGAASLLSMAVTLIAYTVITSRSVTLQTGQMEVQAIAESQAWLVNTEMENALHTARTLAQSLSAMKTEGIQLTRTEVNAMLKQVLVENPQYLGVYTLWEPNAFDGKDVLYKNTAGHDKTGRFIPYWVHSGDAIIQEPLLDYEVEGIGDYYLTPKHTGKEVILDPYVYPINGQDVLMTSLVVPIVVDGKFYGITGVDLPLTFLQSLADKLDIYDKSGRLILFSNNGTLSAVTGKPELINTSIQDFSPDWEEDLEVIQNGEQMIEEEDGNLEIYFPMQFGETTTPWSLNLNIPLQVITAKAAGSVWQMTGIGILLTVLALGLLWFASGTLAKPIKRITAIANRLAQGDLHQDINIDQQDEVGQLAAAFQRIVGYLQNMSSTANQIAEGDLTKDVTLLSNQDELGKSFTQMISRLRSLIGDITEKANRLNVASEQLTSTANQSGQATTQIAATMQQIARGTSQQSESVNKTATSVEQMSRAIVGVARGAQDQTLAVTKAAQITSQIANAIQQVSVNAQAGAKGSQKAAEVAQGGAQTVTATIKGMQTIQAKVDLSAQKVQEMGARSEQIGVIVETIEDIASQTNLLALNAAIEAARVEAQGEKTVENILQQHMLCAVSLVANILESGRELQSSDLITLAEHARVEVLSVSNADGVIIASNDPACLGFRFSENSKDQSSICRPLLNKRDGIAIQPIMARDNDSVPFLYVAISRRDRPGIIQAGTDADVVYRLGGYSRGFSIVADEVRKLAERSANAMKEINRLVKSIQRSVSDAVTAMNAGSVEVERGVEQANQAGLALEQILSTAKEVNQQVVQIASAADQMSLLSNELVAATDAVSAVVEENTAATEEMSAASNEVTQAIENIASISEENSAAVEEVSASAEEMSAQVEEVSASAQSLAELAEALQQVVAQFKLSNEPHSIHKLTQVPNLVRDDMNIVSSLQKGSRHSPVSAL